jgi:hypothetical protein
MIHEDLGHDGEGKESVNTIMRQLISDYEENGVKKSYKYSSIPVCDLSFR